MDTRELWGVLYFADKQIVWVCQKKKRTTFDLECLKCLAERPKGKKKDQGGNTDRQVGKKTEQLWKKNQNKTKQNKQAYNGGNVEKNKRKIYSQGRNS